MIDKSKVDAKRWPVAGVVEMHLCAEGHGLLAQRHEQTPGEAGINWSSKLDGG